MPNTMTALVGGVEPSWVLRDVEVPTPCAGQVLVRVHAAGLNRADIYMLEGSYSPNSKTSNIFTAGLEMAGEVVAVGADVDTVAVGDRVMGAGLGAFAPFAVLDHRHAIGVPESLSWTEAAALPVGLATEHDALVTQGGFTAGQRVAVIGATSAIGLLGVQLAKALGASFIAATTTSDAKKAVLLDAGADLAINTATESVSGSINSATAGSGVDLVLDHLGGPILADALAATKIGGALINIGRLAGKTATINLDQLAFRRLRLQGTTFSVRTADELASVCAALMPAVLPVVAAGGIRAVIDRVFDFHDAVAAADYLRSFTAVGKVVLQVAQ